MGGVGLVIVIGDGGCDLGLLIVIGDSGCGLGVVVGGGG
jgi:hypothetical protein